MNTLVPLLPQISLVELLTDPRHSNRVSVSIFEANIFDLKESSDDVVNCYGVVSFNYWLACHRITVDLPVAVDYWLEKERIMGLKPISLEKSVIPAQIFAQHLTDFNLDDLDKRVDLSIIEQKYLTGQHPNTVLQSLIVGCKCVLDNLTRATIRKFPCKAYGDYNYPIYD